MIKISVVIPTHNREKILQGCLNALFAQTYPAKNFEILICDDGSTDKTGAVVKSLIKTDQNLRYLRQNQKGPAAARNLGIKNAQREIVAFTDDDCLPAKDWLKEIDRAFKKNPTALGIEGKTIPDRLSINLFTYQLINDAGGKYWTCNLAYKKQALLKIGGFDERFRFTHNEDIDLAYRLLQEGKIIFATEVLVIHPTKRMGVFSGLKKLSHLADDFRLYQKHHHYLGRTFPVRNKLAVFFLVAFTHHAFYRLKLIRTSLPFLVKAPFTWLKFLFKNLLEILFILLIFPKAILDIKK